MRKITKKEKMLEKQSIKHTQKGENKDNHIMIQKPPWRKKKTK